MTTPLDGEVTQQPAHDASGAELASEGDTRARAAARLNASSAISVRGVSAFYGTVPALKNISIEIPRKKITALVGPSGCGKSTLLRSLNRMNDLVDIFRLEGEVYISGHDIYARHTDVTKLRKRVGMVFQKFNPFPRSIYENIAYGLRIQGVRRSAEIDEIVEKSLRGAALWDEVKDRLKSPATGLSGGQQQRLCIARSIAISPEILLMDEPCSALDPIATGKIEELMQDLRSQFTIVIVTHNLQQASRCSDYTAFMLSGELVEFGPTVQLFQTPANKRTEDYIRGKYG